MYKTSLLPRNTNFDIIFSSEIKPLIENNLVSNQISTDEIENYLLFGGTNINNDIFDDIKSVKPGNYLEIDITGQIQKIPINKYLNQQTSHTTKKSLLES